MKYLRIVDRQYSGRLIVRILLGRRVSLLGVRILGWVALLSIGILRRVALLSVGIGIALLRIRAHGCSSGSCGRSCGGGLVFVIGVILNHVSVVTRQKCDASS